MGWGVRVSSATRFEDHSYINHGCDITDSFIGRGTFIAPRSRISGAKVGRFCSIGQNVRTCVGRHPSEKWVSTHPAFFSDKKQAGFTFTPASMFDEHLYVDDKKLFVVEIGNDVWIGDDVIIFDGITIGDGAIVGAGAVVTKNIEPYAIVAGVPAKKLRDRYDNPADAEFLRAFRWWDKDTAWLKSNRDYFKDIKLFTDKFRSVETDNRHNI
ncbi:MAG: acetyltransferase [Elusimicrobia bacterium HGW-Elusimicrobia-1]|nr:MAG: acetyltransferase [Elusimicrobia bacterium HGW-Elusimicrobia-1]